MCMGGGGGGDRYMVDGKPAMRRTDDFESERYDNAGRHTWPHYFPKPAEAEKPVAKKKPETEIGGAYQRAADGFTSHNNPGPTTPIPPDPEAHKKPKDPKKPVPPLKPVDPKKKSVFGGSFLDG